MLPVLCTETKKTRAHGGLRERPAQSEGSRTCVYMCMYVCVYIYIYDIYDAGLPHTPSPPLTPWYPPLPVKWVVVLFGLVAFPVWSCLASSPLPSPTCGVGPVVFLVGPAPPVGGQCVLQTYGMVAAAVSSNVIVTCLVPSPPCAVGPVVVLVGPAPPSVFYKDMYGMVTAAC